MNKHSEAIRGAADALATYGLLDASKTLYQAADAFDATVSKLDKAQQVIEEIGIADLHDDPVEGLICRLAAESDELSMTCGLLEEATRERDEARFRLDHCRKYLTEVLERENYSGSDKAAVAACALNELSGAVSHEECRNGTCGICNPAPAVEEHGSDTCTHNVHAFNSEDAEECECGAMYADGSYKQCCVLHDENRCPAGCGWKSRDFRAVEKLKPPECPYCFPKDGKHAASCELASASEEQ